MSLIYRFSGFFLPPTQVYLSLYFHLHSSAVVTFPSGLTLLIFLLLGTAAHSSSYLFLLALTSAGIRYLSPRFKFHVCLSPLQ